MQFSDGITDTQGFIARDDTRKEIVVVLRGRFVYFLLFKSVPNLFTALR